MPQIFVVKNGWQIPFEKDGVEFFSIPAMEHFGSWEKGIRQEPSRAASGEASF